ncbi:glycosyltransferase [Candidatus Nitrosotenuis uzonensis]|uniref:Dolichol-phosphate mannosyltransferase n=1 Tax=Candidatus Nitrosotenuis uzonensis TaxID=1407055 RepID=A0A812EWM1_9ARCH|nr:glycosyltransferase family 2 protein [Candidatus Nitrosotenuis uzonensis]MCA2003416.1 glycosyltransferase family 2 protein [Candidatus Nitrosotenuis sp.]CAE6496672.1 putative glycosyl transferase [Candidatus Nitrosotenuis uzonensis]
MFDEGSSGTKAAQISIIVPTYNESKNILQVLKSIEENLPKNATAQTIVVDDNSPDGTGKIVEEYLQSVKKLANHTIDIIHRKTKEGLSSAILKGIQYATGNTIVVMDSDLSHPPNLLPKMLDALKHTKYDIVIASRYVKGGSIDGWTLKRKIMSKTATFIAKHGLGVSAKDPMSGFFAFRRQVIQGLKFDAIGYKMLLEILVKKKNAKILEIPYTFTNRKFGSSKLDFRTVTDYLRAVWNLYRHGKAAAREEKRPSVGFLSKAGRFYSIGAIGLGINYLISSLFSGVVTHLWYIHATIIGIVVSMTSNFVLNKIWTFEDRDFTPKHTLIQYGKFIGFSSLGALAQIGMVYLLVDQYRIDYPIALITAVFCAALSNFILNKKWTFKEKVWS